MTDQNYGSTETQEVAEFINTMHEAKNHDSALDSANSGESGIPRVDTQSLGTYPAKLQIAMDAIEGQEGKDVLMDAILDSAAAYKKEYGREPTADVFELAFHNAASLVDSQLDSANNDHHDQYSLQPNRAAVAVIGAIASAIPFAASLPADIKSNEARLAILTHKSGDNYGGYAENDSLDGVKSGGSYISSSRIDTADNAGGSHTGRITSIQVDKDNCGTIVDGALATKLLRGRTQIYVHGLPAGGETTTVGTGNSQVSGTVTLAGTTYLIGGVINTNSGIYTITSTPPLDDLIPVTIRAFVDYEKDEGHIPRIISEVVPYKLYAHSWRCYTDSTQDTRVQMANELNLDPHSQSLLAIRIQAMNERLNMCLDLMYRIGKGDAHPDAFNFDWVGQGLRKTRSEIWGQIAPILMVASQEMAERNFTGGITDIYVGKYIAAQLLALPRDIWQPSGIQSRPTTFRIGRLFGMYDVHYTPSTTVDSPTTGEMLCIGRANNPVLNPIIIGETAEARILPLGIGKSGRQGATFYSSGFSELNPHLSSARSATVITVTNLS